MLHRETEASLLWGCRARPNEQCVCFLHAYTQFAQRKESCGHFCPTLFQIILLSNTEWLSSVLYDAPASNE